MNKELPTLIPPLVAYALPHFIISFLLRLSYKLSYPIPQFSSAFQVPNSTRRQCFRRNRSPISRVWRRRRRRGRRSGRRIMCRALHGVLTTGTSRRRCTRLQSTTTAPLSRRLTRPSAGTPGTRRRAGFRGFSGRLPAGKGARSRAMTRGGLSVM